MSPGPTPFISAFRSHAVVKTLQKHLDDEGTRSRLSAALSKIVTNIAQQVMLNDV